MVGVRYAWYAAVASLLGACRAHVTPVQDLARDIVVLKSCAVAPLRDSAALDVYISLAPHAPGPTRDATLRVLSATGDTLRALEHVTRVPYRWTHRAVPVRVSVSQAGFRGNTTNVGLENGCRYEVHFVLTRKS